MEGHILTATDHSFFPSEISSHRIVVRSMDNGLRLLVLHADMELGEIKREDQSTFRANRRFADNQLHIQRFRELPTALRWIFAGYRAELTRGLSRLADTEASIFLRE